jgi:hypothetical protein
VADALRHGRLSAPSVSDDVFVFDNVSGYFVDATTGDVSSNTITFGDGNGDSVTADVGDISHNTITFGGGSGDSVLSAGDISSNKISFGNGNGDEVNSGFDSGDISSNKISFGDGNGDEVNAGNNISNNKISFGNGNGDFVSTFGSFSTSTNNQIIFGNGNNDTVTLPSGAGGDIIITGTGNSDTVQVGAHTSADTFGFALGTGATALSQTTVTGAKAGDQIAVGNSSGLVVTNSGLGNTLVQDGAITGITTVNGLISYLNSHGGLTTGDTYTADSGGNTFVVTDTQSGKVGGIEIVGVAFEHNALANHVLTLGV